MRLRGGRRDLVSPLQALVPVSVRGPWGCVVSEPVMLNEVEALWVTTNYSMRPPTPADLLAVVRRGVESGTIEGEVVGLCRVHRAAYDGVVKGDRFVDGAPGCEMWLGAKLAGVEPKPCNVDLVLVIPVSDVGEDT